MLYLSFVTSILEVLIIVVPMLLAVAFVTVAERKTMASMQRRVGPNAVGYYGLLQAFADALKLILKEYVSPTQANLILFFLGPIITLVFSLLGFAVIPLAPGLTIFDFDIGILYMLAVSSLATYGILLAGWSANSKYAFLGSLRSTAQLISYELVLTSAILVVIFLTSSLNFTVTIEFQKSIWLVLPLLPLFYIFFISIVAETNRAPFDLAEAESELVSGFMTEHSAVIFVFFFLGEYASLVLMSILISLLFLGGYNYDLTYLYYIFDLFYFSLPYIIYFYNKCYYFLLSWDYLYEQLYYVVDTNLFFEMNFLLNTSIFFKDFNYSIHVEPEINYITDSIFYALSLSFKTIFIAFLFIWIRASFPRVRFDQLMLFCWTDLLPLVFGIIIVVPCIIYTFNMFPNNILM